MHKFVHAFVHAAHAGVAATTAGTTAARRLLCSLRCGLPPEDRHSLPRCEIAGPLYREGSAHPAHRSAFELAVGTSPGGIRRLAFAG